MSLRTFSLFYFGHQVTADNQNIDFKEGVGSELTAVLNPGSYTLTTYGEEIKRALDVAGALTYTVTVNRTTRFITITTTSTFSLLTASGSHLGTDAFPMMGFTGANRTGASTYTGNAGSGSYYSPQFILQDHKSSADIESAADGTVLESASGEVEVVRFGTRNFMQAKIRFANDLAQPSAGPIRQNLTGVANLRTFMQYITTKAPIEYMADESTPGTFEKLILESTEENSKGLGFELRERYDLHLPGYYDTSILRFRVTE